MAEHDLTAALDDCIDRLARGQSVEDCLRSYPEYVSQLRPMLETGLLVRRARASVVEVSQAKDRVRFRLEEHRGRWRRKPIGLARVSGTLLLVIVLALVGLGLAAENSLPGDPLYGMKRLTEGIRLVASGNSLEPQFAQRRIDEISRLLAQRRGADVTFIGTVQSISGSVWRIEGLLVTVTPTTPGALGIEKDDRVEVQATTTTRGELIAQAIRLLGKAQPTALPPTVTATATLTGTLTATPAPTQSDTPEPSLTGTEQPSATASATATVSPSPTLTSTPTATLTPSATASPSLSPSNTAPPTLRVPPSSTTAPLPPPTADPQPTDDHGGGGKDGSGGGKDSKGGDSGSGSGSSGGGGSNSSGDGGGSN